MHLHSTASEVIGHDIAPSNKRWLILAMSSSVLFGNYFAYDQVASLNIPLQSYLSIPLNDYQYLISLFYVVYSLPNIFLPFFGGYLIDQFGVKRLIALFGGLIVVGQVLFVIGLECKNGSVAVLGRLLFGLGGENLSVAQARITTKWFVGNDLAFAVGINLSIARLGSVVNDLISPHLAIRYSVSISLWFGFVTCLFSYMCTLLLLYFDSKYEHEAAENNLRESYAMKSSSRSLQVNSDAGVDKEIIEVNSMAKVKGKLLEAVHAITTFPFCYWLVCMVMVFLYGTVVPFNTIHASFLQMKWYPDDPETAAQIMGVPDTISAILVPFVGTFCDRFGHRGHTILLTSTICSVVHLTFAFATSTTLSNPVVMLALLGFAYAMLLTFMACIPLLVDEKYLGLAYGITTSLANFSWTVFPLIVASLIISDSTYFTTELFFFFSSFIGVLVSVGINYLDRTQIGGLLNMPELRFRKGGSVADGKGFTSLRTGGGARADNTIWDVEDEEMYLECRSPDSGGSEGEGRIMKQRDTINKASRGVRRVCRKRSGSMEMFVYDSMAEEEDSLIMTVTGDEE